MRRFNVLLILAANCFVFMAGVAAADIELSFRFNDAEQKEMRAALDVFEKQNPGIKVTLQRIAWANAREQFLREAAVGEGPDIVHIAQVWTRSMGDSGPCRPAIYLVDQFGRASPVDASRQVHFLQDKAERQEGRPGVDHRTSHDGGA